MQRGNVNILIQQLPEYKGDYRSIRKRQSITDLMHDILAKHKKNAADCDRIAKYFWKGSVPATARYIFDFCRNNIHYNEEDTDNQSVKSIGAILIEGEGDCKHYAQFIVGICSALQRMGYPIKAKYRFACYDDTPNEKGVRSGHVFAVIMDHGHEIWCDPVLKHLDQRTPRYISHQDKVPPTLRLSEGAAKIGQVWDVTGMKNGTTLAGGFGNSTTLSGGMGNSTTLSGPHHGFHGGGGHGWGGGYRGPRGGFYGGGTFLDTVYENPYPTYVDPDGLPSLPFAWLRHKAITAGIKITRDAQGVLMERTADSKVSGTGIMSLFDRHPETMGKGGSESHKKKAKAKKPHKGHKLHIKIQPGKLLKKYDPLLASARNATLALFKLNAFHLASQIDAKILHNQAAKDKLWKEWKKLGGNTNKLSTALNQGLKVWNAHHKAHTISGTGRYRIEGAHLMEGHNDDYYSTLGIAPVAIPAMLVAAAPIIAALKSMLKSFGVGVPSKGDIDTATDDTVKAHNKAIHKKKDGGDASDDDTNGDIQADGSVDHGDGVTTQVTKDANGNQVLETKVSEDAGDGGATDEDGGGDEETKTVTKTKTKTVTKSTDEEGGDDTGGGTGIMKYLNQAKDFFVAHETVILGVGVGALVLFKIIIPMATGYLGHPKPPYKRRK